MTMNRTFIVSMVVTDTRLIHAVDEASARRQALAIAKRGDDPNALVVSVQDVTKDFRKAIKQPRSD
jgi:hypothetical protein